MNPKVDFYFTKGKNWQEEIRKLRKVVLDCGLNAELKWGCHCYTFQKRNIVFIFLINDYLHFCFKGSLLNDTHCMFI
jgi:uncharacterized protein YdeI (YjbR/CyaY-like superfamily)